MYFTFTCRRKAVVDCESVVLRKGTRPELRFVTYLYERQRLQLHLNALQLRPDPHGTPRTGKLILNRGHSFAVSVRWCVPSCAACIRRKLTEPQWNPAESQLCFIRVTWSALPGWCAAVQLESPACRGRRRYGLKPASEQGSRGLGTESSAHLIHCVGALGSKWSRNVSPEVRAKVQTEAGGGDIRGLGESREFPGSCTARLLAHRYQTTCSGAPVTPFRKKSSQNFICKTNKQNPSLFWPSQPFYQQAIWGI